MNEMYELLFEGVDESDLFPMLEFILSKTKSHSEFTTMGFPVDVYHEKTDEEVVEFITKLKGGCKFIKRLIDLRVSDTSIIRNLALRIVKYQDLFDIDMVFNYSDINLDLDCLEDERVELLMYNLQEFSYNISKKFTVKLYCAGVEPTYDEEMRYFTNENTGPMMGR